MVVCQPVVYFWPSGFRYIMYIPKDAIIEFTQNQFLLIEIVNDMRKANK